MFRESSKKATSLAPITWSTVEKTYEQAKTQVEVKLSEIVAPCVKKFNDKVTTAAVALAQSGKPLSEMSIDLELIITSDNGEGGLQYCEAFSRVINDYEKDQAKKKWLVVLKSHVKTGYEMSCRLVITPQIQKPEPACCPHGFTLESLGTKRPDETPGSSASVGAATMLDDNDDDL